MNIFDQLAKPFPESEISWRVGSTTKDKDKGIALAFLNARNVMQRLDDVLGPENWQAAGLVLILLAIGCGNLTGQGNLILKGRKVSTVMRSSAQPSCGA